LTAQGAGLHFIELPILQFLKHCALFFLTVSYTRRLYNMLGRAFVLLWVSSQDFYFFPRPLSFIGILPVSRSALYLPTLFEVERLISISIGGTSRVLFPLNRTKPENSLKGCPLPTVREGLPKGRIRSFPTTPTELPSLS